MDRTSHEHGQPLQHTECFSIFIYSNLLNSLLLDFYLSHSQIMGNTKPLSPDPAYAFAQAPRVDGDPWEIVLKPELEVDSVRCHAWKEEVQNLLIFAGLFSAVVTGFVLESYKFLQPDPNAAIISLLLNNAASPNNTLLATPRINPVPIDPAFSHTSPLQINILWFLSLVLSLTTVLIGTISLQWLREHQSYYGFSAKEKLAILHMRTAALEAWYVPQIFAALPILLQGALALFFAGLVDFVLPLGRSLAISVSIPVGMTLLFLVATTVLPACQGLLFFTGFYPYRRPPNPCAFKSPQSHVILTMTAPLLRLLSYIISGIHLPFNFTGMFRRYSLFEYLRQVLKQKSWAASDRKWLDLRDAYHQCIHDKEPDLYEHRQEWADEFPLSDALQVLIKASKESRSAKHTQEYLAAVISCFEELSRSVWIIQKTIHVGPHQRRKGRRNNYFEQLLSRSDCSILSRFIHGGIYNSDIGNLNSKNPASYITMQEASLVSCDQIFHLSGQLLKIHSCPSISQYYIETWTHMMTKSHILALKSPADSSPSMPTLVAWRPWYNAINSIGAASNFEKYSTTVVMLTAVFESAAQHHISEDKSLNAVCTHPGMSNVLYWLAFWSYDYLKWAKKIGATNISDRQQLHEIDVRYNSIFKFVAKHLEIEVSTMTSNIQADTPSVMFYLASVFIREILNWLGDQVIFQDAKSKFGPGFASSLGVLLRYKTRTSGRRNRVLEARLRREGNGNGSLEQRYEDRFSDEMVGCPLPTWSRSRNGCLLKRVKDDYI